MKLKIIAGSNRANSNSRKIADAIQERCNANIDAFDTVNTLDFADVEIPHWDEEFWSKSEKWAPVKQDVLAPMQDDDAFVIITPEYSGMVPGILKNFFLLCSAKEMGHKPALIVSVSTGTGGSYPVAELRMSSYKNTRLCYIPDHIIVRDADNFGDDHPVSERLDYSLTLLGEYAKGLKPIRESGLINTKDFPYGL